MLKLTRIMEGEILEVFISTLDDRSTLTSPTSSRSEGNMTLALNLEKTPPTANQNTNTLEDMLLCGDGCHGSDLSNLQPTYGAIFKSF